MATQFIGFYKRQRRAVGLSESMYADLGLLDIAAVLANAGSPRASRT